MNPSFDRFKKIDSPNSVTNEQNSQSSVDDLTKPYTLIEWIINSNLDLGSPEQHIQQYSVYLHAWNAKSTTKARSNSNVITESYKTLLKQITLKFTSTEEKRFLTNLDLNNPLDLEVAIPFFAKKLKDVVLFLAKKRDETKFQKTKYSLFGTNEGIESLAAKVIIQLVNTEDFILEYLDDIPNLADTSKNINIQTDELYDIDDTYFDVDPCDSDDSGVDYDPYIFVDFTNAIKLLSDDLGTILQSTSSLDIFSTDSGSLAILADSTNIDIQNLPISQFEDYTKSEESLNLHNQKDLVNQLIGNNLTYLSSGSNKTDAHGNTQIQYITGSSASPTNHIANFFNTIHPTINYKPNKTSLHTNRTLGSFFTPQHLGTTSFASINPHLIIDTSQLGLNDIYEIPDPSIYGSTKHKFIDHIDNASWIKYDKSNDYASGFIVNSNNLQKFDNHQTIVESNRFSQQGIGLIQDNFDFWKGSMDDIWANADIYPPKSNNIIDNNTRHAELLVNKEDIYKWSTDIYGNNFTLFKSQYPNKRASLTQYTENTLADLAPIYLGTCELLDGGPLVDIILGTDFTGSFQFTAAAGLLDPSPVVTKNALGYELATDYCPNMNDFNGNAIVYECNTIDGEDQPVDFTNYTATITGTKAYGFQVTDHFLNGGLTTPADTLWDGQSLRPGPCDPLGSEQLRTLAEYKTLNVPMLSTTLAAKYQSDLQAYSTPITNSLSIYDHRNNSYGELWARNINHTIIQPISSALVDLYSKYEAINPTIKNELLYYVKDFDIIYDTLIIQTKNYVILEKLNYNYTTNQFIKSNTTNYITVSSEPLNKGINHFFNENTNKLYIGGTKTTDYDTVTGQAVYPEIYEYDLVSPSIRKIFPDSQDLNVFGMPYDLTVQKAGTIYTNIHHPIISYNETTDKYYITNTCTLSSKHIPGSNLAGTPDLVGQDDIFAISQSTYQFIDNKFTYLDSQLYFPPNSGSNTTSTQTDSLDIDLSETQAGYGRWKAGWSGNTIGPLSAINFTLNISAEKLIDTNHRFIKFIYDFNDGSDLEVVYRNPVKNDITLLTNNDSTIDDPNNPKYISKSHTYTFTSSAAATQTAHISAILANHEISVFEININRQASTITSSFSALRLIESKPFMDSNFTENNLLLLESQNPRYIIHMTLKGSKYNKTRFNY
jgi:hypothetical protein